MSCDPSQESIAEVTLKVNGADVELNTFVQGFVTETITGMVKSLRGVDEVKSVSLQITRK
ncbi:MAG: hypothetical protein FVQ80_04400 [Planctomycetes bacterium]|nr:hypothetical protein [Planctomycetota bacterium]